MKVDRPLTLEAAKLITDLWARGRGENVSTLGYEAELLAWADAAGLIMRFSDGAKARLSPEGILRLAEANERIAAAKGPAT